MPGVDDVTLARSEVHDVDRAVDAEALTAGLEAEAALAAEEVLHATELRGDLHALTAGHPVAADDEAGAIGLGLERQHVAGQDAVVICLGIDRPGRTTLFSETTKAVVEAMGAAAVRRLVAVTGVGAPW